jgi:RNA polymerase sigma factor (TIGR02999 family)
MDQAGAVRKLDEMLVQLQAELRQIAARQFAKESPGHTLQPTAIVNEAYLRLLNQQNLQDASKATILAAAAKTIRRLLVDHARAKHAKKRGGGVAPVRADQTLITLGDLEPGTPSKELDVLALNDALEKLRGLGTRLADVVELRFFGGLTVDETAASLGVSPRTVADDWVFARAWLRRQLQT